MASIIQEGHLMPSRGQSVVLTYIAWDTSANGGKTGDAANHTLRWIKDGASSAPTNASSEIDTTNAPGAYKITLTTAECTCDTGTLAGKSSTANVSIVPISISFEQLPTVAAGETNGLPIVDSSGRAKANVEAINGSETSGNNATLNLKKLSVVNDSGDAVVFSATGEGPGISGSGLEIKGSHGEYGMKIEGGSFGGGLHLKANTNAHALAIYGAGIGNGVYVSGGNGGDGIRIYGGSNNKDAIGLFHYGTGHDFQGDIFGNISGSVGSISTVRPKKNTGLDNFMFPMFDSTTKNPKTGLTVTAERAIDGNPFAACSASAVELSNGVYRVSLSASDLNGNKIMLRFSAPGADDQLVEIITQD